MCVFSQCHVCVPICRFQSYLSGSYQKVICVDGKLSEPLGIHSDVPQGSILGPALFLLFINDLSLVLKNNIGIYADDSTLYASAPTLAEVEEKIRPDIDAVSMWAKENKMKMHPAKTKYSIISTRQKIANSAKQSLDLSVDCMQLTKVESERVLGVYIDSQNEHIDTLRRKLLFKAMRRTFFYSTIKELKALNLEATTSFSLMKTTLTNNVASNYTVDNFKVKKLF